MLWLKNKFILPVIIKKFLKFFKIIPSLPKFKYKNGAVKESRPCQYTYWGLSLTHAFSNLWSLLCPVEDDNKSLYWWHLGISTSIWRSVWVGVSLSIISYRFSISPVTPNKAVQTAPLTGGGISLWASSIIASLDNG